MGSASRKDSPSAESAAGPWMRGRRARRAIGGGGGSAARAAARSAREEEEVEEEEVEQLLLDDEEDANDILHLPMSEKGGPPLGPASAPR